MDAKAALGRLPADAVGDESPPVAALRHPARMTEPPHQFRPGPGNALHCPARLRRLGREAVAGQRGDHEMEGVFGSSPMRHRIAQRADHTHELDHRAWPAMGQQQWHRTGLWRADMEEMNVEPIDLGDELPQSVEPRLASPPVIARAPIGGEILQHGQRRTLRPVVDRLALGPTGRVEPAVKVVDLVLRDRERERTDIGHAATVKRGALRSSPNVPPVLTGGRWGLDRCVRPTAPPPAAGPAW